MDSIRMALAGRRRCGSLMVAALGALTIGHATLASSQTAASWVSTRTHAHPTRSAVFREYLAPNESVKVVIPLKLRNPEDLDSKVAALLTPGSPQFRQWLTHGQVLAEYAPTAAQARRVADYLSQAGFTDVRIAAGNFLVSAQGSASVVRKAFNTELARFTRGSAVGIVNTTDAQVPVSLADVVESVLGLQTLDVPKPSQISPQVQPLTPRAFARIYGTAALPAPTSTVVGVITEGNMSPVTADLHTYEASVGLISTTPTVDYFAGNSGDTSNLEEWDLDTQTITGITGAQLGGLILYAMPSMSDADLTQNIHEIVTKNAAKVINGSLGICEYFADMDGSLAADDSLLEVAVAQGQTFVFSTGDVGTGACAGVSTTASVQYPASSPYVIAVGGTTLTTYITHNAGPSVFNYDGETGWPGSGGGASLYESMPTWQVGTVPVIAPNGGRGLPDVAFDGDPNSGALIYFNGVVSQVGGTSLAAPIFTAGWATVQSAHGNSLGFPAASLYSIGAANTNVFRDVTSGCNGTSSCAGVGWDPVTGLGSLIFSGLSSAL